jgi:hypothetical protein
MERDPTQPKFEEVYPQYEFAPLVRLVLTIAEWIKRQLDRKPRATRPATTIRHAAR